MDSQWMLTTHGDPLGALREFVSCIWRQSRLDGMLVPSPKYDGAFAQPTLLTDPAQLSEINPFNPLMALNAAGYLPKLLQEKQEIRLGAILRPCEMRALIEVAKRVPFEQGRLVTISIDCLGTFPVEDYAWRVERKGNADDLARESLQFARTGGMAAYRLRSACQMCASPGARGAGLNVGIFGLPIRQYILIKARDEAAAEQFHLADLTYCKADPKLVSQRERMLAKLIERHDRTRERVTHGLADLISADLDELVSQLSNCGACQACLDACPICIVDRPRRDARGKYLRKDIKRWLISCAGCGMCEQACPGHLPLSAIFGTIREQLVELYSYIPGRYPREPLPII